MLQSRLPLVNAPSGTTVRTLADLHDCELGAAGPALARGTPCSPDEYNITWSISNITTSSATYTWHG